MSALAPAVRRYAPIVVLAVGLILFFLLGGHELVSFTTVRAHHEVIVGWVADHRTLSIVVFATGYAAMVAFSLPGGVIGTLLAGFLFGPVMATALVVVAATVGATVLFLAARTAFRETFVRKAGGAVLRMEAGFRENALSYMMFLRLVPVFPFWLVNLVPALLGVPLRTYVLATAVGIIPGTLVYALIGNGLGRFLDADESPDLAMIFEWPYLAPLLALAALSLLPVVIKRLRRGHTPGRDDPTTRDGDGNT